MSTVITKGNPYTHCEETRECLTKKDFNIGSDFSCSWCGSKKKRLYKYNNSKGMFCDKNCFEAYNF